MTTRKRQNDKGLRNRRRRRRRRENLRRKKKRWKKNAEWRIADTKWKKADFAPTRTTRSSSRERRRRDERRKMTPDDCLRLLREDTRRDVVRTQKSRQRRDKSSTPQGRSTHVVVGRQQRRTPTTDGRCGSDDGKRDAAAEEEVKHTGVFRCCKKWLAANNQSRSSQAGNVPRLGLPRMGGMNKRKKVR